MRYMFTVPHPDDFEIACAILSQKLVKDGHTVQIIVVTSGELAGDTEVREQEATASCKLLGLDTPRFLRFPQLQLIEQRVKLQHLLEDMVKDYRPDAMFVPWEKDINEDHMTVTNISLVAGRSVKNIYFYPTLSSRDFIPDTTVFSDKVMLDKKYKALSLHTSQVSTGRVDPERVYITSENILHQFSHHSLKSENGIQMGEASAEAFKVLRQELITAL